MLSHKLRVLVTRAVFPSVIDRLSQHFHVESNPDDVLWDREELLRRVEGKDGLFVFGTERIDAELLSRSPSLRIAANMTVGYNNFDLPAMSHARVLGTNAGDVLTETTVPPPCTYVHICMPHVLLCDQINLLLPGRFRLCAADGDRETRDRERALSEGWTVDAVAI